MTAPCITTTPQTGDVGAAGRTQYVAEPESGERVAYTDNRGYTELMGFSGGLNSAGYKEKTDFVPGELGVG